MSIPTTYGSVPVDESTVELAQKYVTENAPQFMEYTKNKFKKLEQYAKDGHYTWRVLALIAGLSIFGLGLLSLLSDFFGLSPFNVVLDFYLILFGIAAICLEYKEKLMTAKYLSILQKQALFLYNPYGRALFYLFIGVLILVKGGFISFFIGLYTSCVGIFIYYNSTKAYAALNQLKKSDPNARQLSEGEVVQKFYSFDKNNDGFIDASELNNLCLHLDHHLSESELMAALLILDANDDGKITMDEFKSWWSAQE